MITSERGAVPVTLGYCHELPGKANVHGQKFCSAHSLRLVHAPQQVAEHREFRERMCGELGNRQKGGAQTLAFTATLLGRLRSSQETQLPHTYPTLLPRKWRDLNPKLPASLGLGLLHHPLSARGLLAALSPHPLGPQAPHPALSAFQLRSLPQLKFKLSETRRHLSPWSGSQWMQAPSCWATTFMPGRWGRRSGRRSTTSPSRTTGRTALEGGPIMKVQLPAPQDKNPWDTIPWSKHYPEHPHAHSRSPGS